MRQRELLEFRTPQHPSSGTTNWGGASPLLARNIPKEALDQRYLRLNTIRERDQLVFPYSTTIGDEIFGCPQITTTIGYEIFISSKADDARKYEYSATPRRRGLLRKLQWRPYKRSAMLGSNSMFPKWNSKKRWPNGWC